LKESFYAALLKQTESKGKDKDLTPIFLISVFWEDK